MGVLNFFHSATMPLGYALNWKKKKVELGPNKLGRNVELAPRLI